MATSFIDTNNDPFAAISQDVSTQRKQIAQYAIMQAATYMQNGQNDQAIGAFKKALVIDSQNSTAYNYLGKIYLSQGKNTDAIKAYQQLVRIQSNSSIADTATTAPTKVDAHISLGNAYLQDKQYTAAEKEFKAAAKLDPLKPLAPYSLGLLYSNTGRVAEAETEFLKAKKISPKDGNVYYALGMVYNKQGRYEEAAATLEKSITLKNDLPSANYELGVAYDALGRTEDARNQLSILQGSDSSLALDLLSVLNKPGITAITTKNSGGFNDLLFPGTPLWMLDPALLNTQNASKTFSIAVSFSTTMDPASIADTQNWSISRANSAGGGYYNYGMPLRSIDVVLPSKPESVFYNSLTNEAIVTFRLNQNANGDAVIDTQHLAFKFTGKDVSGKDMDVTANEIDGYSGTAF